MKVKLIKYYNQEIWYNSVPLGTEFKVDELNGQWYEVLDKDNNLSGMFLKTSDCEKICSEEI